jgi:two-component system NarL family sensor kinase
LWDNLPVTRKLDADALLSLLLIGLVITGYVALVYVLVIALFTPLPFSASAIDAAPPWWQNVIAFALIALTFLPVYRWTRRGVRDLVYGQHENPYPVLAQISQRFESTPSPQTILPAVTETIALTLKLPFVEIEAQLLDANSTGAARLTTYGSLPKGAAIQHLPLIYYDTAIGELRVAERRAGEPLSPSDLSVLGDLARQVGISLYAAQLTDDLQRARERLVIAREAERRRIRNDLHDGLAPTLSSMLLQLGAARNLIRRDPDKAEALLNELGEDLRGATAAIRQLVYDLRPPLLDELGLVGAIKSFKFPDPKFCFEVHEPDPLPELPAAVEVAAYRIASEALHNVVKHAQASECLVEVEVSDDQLTLSVADNGMGMMEAYTAGVGLASMRERAAELGGALTVRTCEGGGACVIAQLPLVA